MREWERKKEGDKHVMDNKDESIEETYSDIVRDRTLRHRNIKTCRSKEAIFFFSFFLIDENL